MNGKELFEGLGDISQKYYEEAETAAFPPARKHFRKPILIAALISLTLLLAGCAVVYVMKMQDMKVGEQEVTNPVYNEYMEFQGNETVSQHVLTLAGLKGTPGYQAAQEWYKFENSYDPDHEIFYASKHTDQEFSHDYDAYSPYSQEMADKLDEIANKHSLKLQGPLVKLHGGKRFYEEMGIDSILMPESKASAEIVSTHAYESGSWYIDFFKMKMPEEEGQWPYQMANWLSYLKKDCFSTDLVALDDTGDWIEWNYTTASGQTVLMMMSRSDYAGWIICDRADAMIAVRVEVRNDAGYNEDGKQWFDSTYMSNKQFEKVADAIDFNMKPEYQGQAVSDVDTSSMSQTNNGYTIEVKDVATDGYAAIITLGVTGPEGSNLVKNKDFSLINRNWSSDDFVPVSGRQNWGSRSMATEDDMDGLGNTCNLVIRAAPYYEDRNEMPFPADAVWNIYFEDLLGSWWDHELGKEKEEVLAEGVWNFDVTFQNGDFREYEMVTKPVTAPSNTGWTADGENVFEDVEIYSIRLRSCSATITHSGDSVVGGVPGYNLFVVMKDGSQVEMWGGGGIYDFRYAIDLDQVDHILLPDGTKLPMQEAHLVTPESKAAPQDIPEDPRELELIESPVKGQVYFGMDPVDGHDVYGEIEIQSFILRQNSAFMDIGDGNFIDMSVNPNTSVVMKDGSRIRLVCHAGTGGAGSQITWQTEAPIDLDQADYVLLPDGTQLPVQ